MFGKDKKKEAAAEEVELKEKERIAENKAKHEFELERFENEFNSIMELSEKQILANILYELRENNKWQRGIDVKTLEIKLELEKLYRGLEGRGR
jgi:hypothetical protein